MNYKEIRENIYSNIKAEIPDSAARLDWPRYKILKHQATELGKLIKHAKLNSSWYREKYRDINPEDVNLNNINQLPVLTKKEVMDNWDDIVCDKTITRKIAEEHQRKCRDGIISNPYYKDHYLFYSTGGSSGSRGLFVRTKELVETYGCIMFRHDYRDELKSFPGIRRVAVIVSPSRLHSSAQQATLIFREYMEILYVSATTPLELICNKLNKFQPTHIVGFSSIVNQLALLQLRNHLNITPFKITVGAEMLDEDGADNFMNAWGIICNNILSSTETGPMAVEDETHSGMILAEDYNIFETVNRNFTATDRIDDIAKLVVTHFPNRVLPLIRYVLDDIVDIGKNFSNYRVINKLLGRCDDYFTYNDIHLHPICFRHVLGQTSEIIEYQVFQTKKGADILIICNDEPDVLEIKKRLIETLYEGGLENPELTISRVNKIKRHRETAKFRRFVPLF
ncbi:MAG: phenylacetate--CoA ligase family protein [bacterium]|nr:phenylacetate--CoA ligase family protein [bacterium]